MVADDEVSGRLENSVTLRSVCAVRVRPRDGAVQLPSAQRDKQARDERLDDG